MTTKEIKELALQILNRNGETGIKKSDFTVRQAKQLIKEYNLGWMKQKGTKNMTEIVWQEIKKSGEEFYGEGYEKGHAFRITLN